MLICFLILMAIFVYLGLAYLFFSSTILPEKRGYDWYYQLHPRFLGLKENRDYIEFSRTPEDKADILLHSFFLFPQKMVAKRKGKQKIIIISHMFRRSKEKLWGVAFGLRNRGYHVLLYDFRGHGASTNTWNGMSSDKLPDLKAMYDWALEKYPQAQIYLMGYSMGASLSLRAAAQWPQIRAVVADSPFLNMGELFSYHIWRKYHFPPILLVTPLVFLIRKIWGFRLKDDLSLDISELIRKNVPTRIIYGERDHVVPYFQRKRIISLFPQKDTVMILPTAGHYGGFFMNNEIYLDSIVDFLRDK